MANTQVAGRSASPSTGRWVLFSTILASSMAFIDGSALNVALPALQRDLGASAVQVFWVVSAYALFLAALLLVGGALGDIYGRKRVYMIGIVVFAIASLACGLAPTTIALIGARAVQGIGAALMIPGSLALIAANFGEEQRGRAIGTWSSFTTLTTILGPALGGFLAGNGLWRTVFFINLPLALAALAALLLRVPESRDESAARRLDYAGATLVTLGLAGLTFGLLQAPEFGWGAPTVWGAMILGLAALVAFVVVERRVAHPMVPLRLFTSRTFSGTNLMTLFLYAALSGVLFFLPLNLIQVQGYNEVLAGLATLPTGILLGLLSRWTGGLLDRFGARLPLTVGPALAGLGFAMLALPGLTGGPGDYWTSYFPALLVLGLGMAITVAPLTTAVMGAVSAQQAGIASGVNNAVSRAAGALAVALFGVVALGVFSGALQGRTAPLELPEQSRAELQVQAAKLGAAEPPASVPEAATAPITEAIRLSFVDTFRLLALLGASLAWVSAAVSWFTVDGKPEASSAAGGSG